MGEAQQSQSRVDGGATTNLGGPRYHLGRVRRQTLRGEGIGGVAGSAMGEVRSKHDTLDWADAKAKRAKSERSFRLREQQR